MVQKQTNVVQTGCVAEIIARGEQDGRTGRLVRGNRIDRARR
jgi:hypothetical protein